jgi:hypothetical protein
MLLQEGESAIESKTHGHLCLLGRCPTRAVGESTTLGSKPYRYGLQLHKAFPHGLR